MNYYRKYLYFRVFKNNINKLIRLENINKLPHIELTLMNNNNICTICYNKINIEEEKTIIKLECNHLFHKKCIKKWLLLKARCPNCNLRIVI